MTSNEISKHYAAVSAIYEQLKDEIVFILETELAKSGIAVHLIEGRVKTWNSLLDKERRQELEDPLEAQDICGIRVITLFMSDLEKCRKIISEVFEIDTVDEKISEQPETQFDYMSNHYLANCRKASLAHAMTPSRT